MDFGQFVARVRMLLDDVASPPQYTEALIRDGLSSALGAILPWCPNREAVTPTQVSPTVYRLPERVYRVEFVMEGDTVVRPASLSADAIDYFSNGWFAYPTNGITFIKPPSQPITAYCLTHWPVPSLSSDVIPTPEYTYTALTFYTAAYCLIPGAVSSASIRQFNMRVDSGTPEDNPLATRVRELLALFEREMNRHQPYLQVGRK